jgi:hypothetical protein
LSFKGTRFGFRISDSQISIHADKDAEVLINNSRLKISAAKELEFNLLK